MFIEIPPRSPDRIRLIVFRGSLPMPGSRFWGFTSRVFQKWATMVGT